MERHIDRIQQAYFATTTVDYWLSIRLELFGAIITAVIACLATLATDSRSGIPAAMIGIVLVNAQRITSVLNIQIRSVMYFEGHLVSLRRIIEYTELPVEDTQISLRDISSSWPEHGAITFRNYSTRYREGLGEVLRNLNLTIQRGEKIGVVGRTGAGKSTFALAL
jgi:ABC-type multidrug transport system fused ATPase/permease subunit